MRKEGAEIDEKYLKTVIATEKLKRQAYFKTLQSNVENKKSMKGRKKALKKYIVNKNYLLFNKIQRSIRKKIGKLSLFCRQIYLGVSLKMLKR